MHLRDTACLFCLHPSGARLGLDRKGRPYLHCVICGARAFLPVAECLHGPALLPSLIAAWRAELTEDQRRQRMASYLADLRRRAAQAQAAPPTTADAALTAAMEKIA